MIHKVAQNARSRNLRGVLARYMLGIDIQVEFVVAVAEVLDGCVSGCWVQCRLDALLEERG
jgi:hypothetical protein